MKDLGLTLESRMRALSSLPLAIAWYPFFPIQTTLEAVINDVQLAWFVAPDKKVGALAKEEEMYLTDEIGYVSLTRVGCICNLHASVMPMSKLWL